LSVLTFVLIGVAKVSITYPTACVDAQETQSPEKEIVSLLKQKCFQCHSADVQMSGLDLSTREAILKGGEHGPAIVPGKAEASRLYRRVAGLEKPFMPMAPLPSLTPQESANDAVLAALTDLAHVMLNSNEFVYIN